MKIRHLNMTACVYANPCTVCGEKVVHIDEGKDIQLLCSEWKRYTFLTESNEWFVVIRRRCLNFSNVLQITRGALWILFLFFLFFPASGLQFTPRSHLNASQLQRLISSLASCGHTSISSSLKGVWRYLCKVVCFKNGDDTVDCCCAQNTYC